MSFAEWSNNRKKQKEEGASQTVAYEAAPSGNSDTGYSFSQWSNNRKKQREESASQTVAYEATPLRNSDTSCSFSQWSNNKKSEEAEKSAVGWLNASQNLLTEVQNYYQHWSNDDTQYRSFQDRASNLLSGADSWRKEYAGNDEAIKVIDSAVCSLSNLKKYAMKCQDYYSDWATEEQYQRAKEYYDTWGHYLEADDFEYYSALGAAIQNPSIADAQGYFNFFGWRPGSEEVGNIVTYSRDNYANIAAMSEGGKYDVVGDLRYKDMTDDEVAIYNYLLAKEGKERAGEFLSYIEEDLNARGGKRTADLITSINIPVVEELATGLYGLGAGIDQWISGTRQLFTNEQLPISIAQYANSEIADSLDGFGKNLYTGANVIGNMAPSILLSYVTAGLGAPAAVAQGVGAAAVGMSAAGNAYGSALADGYSIGQARAYSTLVGAAEGTLQYILGGISSLGGVTDDLIKAKINMIDNSLLRIGAKLGVDVFSEVTEEELQNFLEPAFRSIIFGEEYDAPTIDEMLETAIVTAGTTLLLGGSGTVSSDLAANKLLNATAQMTNDQTNTPYNQEDVANRLMDKGFNPEKAANMAEVIAARLNGQQLTKIQTGRLRAATDNAVVRDVMYDITKEKAEGIDSTQHNAYDKGNIVDGRENSEESAPRGIAKQSVDVNTKLEYDTDADQAEYEKYRSILRENAPETYEEFQTLKYGHPEKWDNLQRKYRIVDRYEVCGNVKIDTILRLDDAAWQTKQTGFSAENLTGKAKERIKDLASNGNAAVMSLDGDLYFAHSRVGKPGDPGYQEYKGQYPLITLKEKRRFTVLDLGDGVPRYHDTEAKFLEYVADIKAPTDAFEITILSEKHICKSCEHVVEQFQRMFPNAKVNIVSGKPGYNESPEGLKTWKHRKKVQENG